MESRTCPNCGAKMEWKPGQGPRGGWECPKCGLKIDHKPSM